MLQIKFRRPFQRGIGLLELMLSLAIISLLLVMATRYYQSTRLSQQVNDGIALVNALVAASENAVAGENNYEGITVTKLKDLGLLPAQIDADGKSSTPWHTNLEVAPTNQNNQIKITFTGIPSEACRNLILKLHNQMDTVNSVCGSDTGNFVAIYG